MQHENQVRISRQAQQRSDHPPQSLRRIVHMHLSHNRPLEVAHMLVLQPGIVHIQEKPGVMLHIQHISSVHRHIAEHLCPQAQQPKHHQNADQKGEIPQHRLPALFTRQLIYDEFRENEHREGLHHVQQNRDRCGGVGPLVDVPHISAQELPVCREFPNLSNHVSSSFCSTSLFRSHICTSWLAPGIWISVPCPWAVLVPGARRTQGIVCK